MFVDTLTTHTTRAVHKGRRGRGERETGHGRHRRPSTVGCSAVRRRRRQPRLGRCGRRQRRDRPRCLWAGGQRCALGLLHPRRPIGRPGGHNDRAAGCSGGPTPVGDDGFGGSGRSRSSGRADLATIAFRVTRRHDRQADARARSVGGEGESDPARVLVELSVGSGAALDDRSQVVELQERVDQLERTNHQLETLACTAAHELKAPLASSRPGRGAGVAIGSRSR